MPHLERLVPANERPNLEDLEGSSSDHEMVELKEEGEQEENQVAGLAKPPPSGAQFWSDGWHISFDDSNNTPVGRPGTMHAYRFGHEHPSLHNNDRDAHKWKMDQFVVMTFFRPFFFGGNNA